MEIEIEIFYHSDETITAKNTGMEYSILECDSKIMTFYNIDCIAPYEDEESKTMFCKIISGGENFIATKDYKEIKKMIENKYKNA